MSQRESVYANLHFKSMYNFSIESMSSNHSLDANLLTVLR
ncbi:hypothetical protein K661_01985 [Piscirickettsia salmonis LF-89 = ATCC VR-1361]|nr:hypothetical protein K661_01985 [Piscirickettsia salmonis LF-89 = ATCC VR-1361]